MRSLSALFIVTPEYYELRPCVYVRCRTVLDLRFLQNAFSRGDGVCQARVAVLRARKQAAICQKQEGSGTNFRHVMCLVAAGVVLGGHENEAGSSFDGMLRGAAASLQDADDRGVSRNNTNSNRRDYGNAEN